MTLTATQSFLIHASRAAGMNEYFRWGVVGRSMGLSEPEADRVVQALDQQKLVRRLADGDARLLPGGRQLVARLEARLRSER